MSRSYTPVQNQFNTPYSQIIHQNNNIDSKVYLSRISNFILKAIGNDLVLSGLDLVINNNIDKDTISITINPGLLIQDTTLIEVLEPVTLTLNIRPYDQSNGYLIVYTSFQYLNTTTQNDLQIKLSYINTNGINIQPPLDSWDPNYNRILLYRFTFSKIPNASIQEVEDPYFTIYNKRYYLKGETNFTNFSSKILDHSSDSPTYGYATNTKAGHVRIGNNLTINDGTISVPEATDTNSGVVKLASIEEAILMESNSAALTPASVRQIILSLKDIEIQMSDPGVTLGTALVL